MKEEYVLTSRERGRLFYLTFRNSRMQLNVIMQVFLTFLQNSSAKKTKRLPFGQKLKPIFVQKLKLGAAFLNNEKKFTQGQGFNISKKLNILKICPGLIDWDTLAGFFFQRLWGRHEQPKAAPMLSFERKSEFWGHF